MAGEELHCPEELAVAVPAVSHNVSQKDRRLAGQLDGVLTVVAHKSVEGREDGALRHGRDRIQPLRDGHRDAVDLPLPAHREQIPNNNNFAPQFGAYVSSQLCIYVCINCVCG